MVANQKSAIKIWQMSYDPYSQPHLVVTVSCFKNPLLKYGRYHIKIIVPIVSEL